MMTEDERKARTLWVWVVELDDGSVSQVGGMVEGVHTSLSTRSRKVAEVIRPIARKHAEDTMQRVFLREYRFHADHGEA